jgi:lariat debranching enzyme
MWELYYGGWIAPNIYYLGNTGCVRVDGLRIMGMSGIFKSGDYHKGKLSSSEMVKLTSRTLRKDATG